VLLSLSSLQHKLQPATEVTPLLPSSFAPLVNKLLQQQLGMAMLLETDITRTAGKPLMWHVWWHIGVRRYHWVQQQKLQQQGQQQQEDEECAADSEQLQQQNAAAAVSKSSKARSKQKARKQQQQQQALAAARQVGLQPLTAGQLSALYADPAARYYAAGFAARQTAAYGTGLRARAALRTSHMMAYKQVDEMLEFGRMRALVPELDFPSAAAKDDIGHELIVLQKLLNQGFQVGTSPSMCVCLPWVLRLVLLGLFAELMLSSRRLVILHSHFGCQQCCHMRSMQPTL
jgi:hypothetical protein